MKTEKMKRNLDEMKSSMNEIHELARSNNSASENTIAEMKKRIYSSIENIVDDPSPLVTFPDDDENPDLQNCLGLVNSSTNLAENGLSSTGLTTDTVKFEEKRTKIESKTMVVKDGFSSEQATSNSAESKRLQTGDVDYQEAKAQAAMRNRLEVGGYKTEESAAMLQEKLSLRTGDITQQASKDVAAASIKVTSDNFSADKKSISQSQQSQTHTSNGVISQEKHVSSASQSNYSITHKGVSTSGTSNTRHSLQMSETNGAISRLADLRLDDLQALTSSSSQRDIEQAISKYTSVFESSLKDTRAPTPADLDIINDVIRHAWAVPTHGHQLGYSLCGSLRKSGGLDLLMKNCVQSDMKIKFSSAKLLEQCLTTENRDHVVHNGLDKVVNVACVCTSDTNTEHSRVGTGILEHLFKHSEGTCSDVIKLGGLDAVLFECRKNDIETLRHCASALANLSLYGGAENQEAMINRKVPMWLFPLAFHDDDNIKYYACLAIAVLVANKEIEAEVLKSGCLDLVEPFVTSRDPSKFAKSNLAHAHGQSETWLKRLVPVLSSNREEARSLAAFHFCMEAGIKRVQGETKIFEQIGAIEALKTVASCPNAIASKFAAQALRLIGEEVPHKLSQQVPLWSIEDVKAWVKQIDFAEFANKFEESRVDGDLLLKLNTEHLKEDIGLRNGIRLMRFERELQHLKRRADYSSKDPTKIHHFLINIDPEYSMYTYSFLQAGIDKTGLHLLNEDMLIKDCEIHNSIHRRKILGRLTELQMPSKSASEENMAKTLDVFVSYRRSNGSQLASLLKVHLQLRGFSVFIDVERLEAGKFDNGLLHSIRQAKNFVLVLTPNALERCVEDEEGKDWVHREIVEALQNKCNIIPIIDQNFAWPETEKLPEDMRTVCHFNGVNWIHDYQDACIDKLERFMRGEKMGVGDYRRMHSNDPDYQGTTSGSGVGSGGVVGSSNAVCSANGGGSGGQANHQANRYRQSPSPARRIGVGAAYGGRTSRVPLPPHRTVQAAHKAMTPVSGSLQNVSPSMFRPPRRSSAVGICTDSTKPATSNYRSQSVDGLHDSQNTGSTEAVTSDQRIAEAAALVTAGSIAMTNASSTRTLQPSDDNMSSMNSLAEEEDDNVAKREKITNLPPINPQHRKSRSLDHFLNEQTLAAVVAPSEPIDGTQSMQNLAMPLTPEPPRIGTRQQQAQRIIAARDSKSATPELPSTPSTNANLVTRQSPEGVSSTEDEREDTQSLQNSSRQSSCSLPPKSQTRAAAHVHRGSQSHNANANNNNMNFNHGGSISSKASSSSLGSANSGNPNPNNKTIFNRTMKKVRSLMKNNDSNNSDELNSIILATASVPTAGRSIFW